MQITKDTVVTLQYKVADANGKLVEQSKDPMVYLHGGYDNTLPKIEAALEGQARGFQTTWRWRPKTPSACATSRCCAPSPSRNSRRA